MPGHGVEKPNQKIYSMHSRLWRIIGDKVREVAKEDAMTVLEVLQKRVERLPPAQQREVLDFAEFLAQRVKQMELEVQPRSLRSHPAFGIWRERAIDGLSYQETLRAEWDDRP